MLPRTKNRSTQAPAKIGRPTKYNAFGEQIDRRKLPLRSVDPPSTTHSVNALVRIPSAPEIARMGATTIYRKSKQPMSTRIDAAKAAVALISYFFI
jgi:hypothetical protein